MSYLVAALHLVSSYPTALACCSFFLAATLWLARCLWFHRLYRKDVASTESNENVIAVVGASFSGLSLAQKAVDAGFKVVLFDKLRDNLGVWSTTKGSANTYSRLQIEHYVYCHLQEIPECSSCYPRVDEIQNFLDNRVAALLKTGCVKIRYGCDVVRLVEVDNGVCVKYKTIDDGKERSEIFSSVHVRTGSQSRPNRLHVPGLQENFNGRWCYGVADGIEDMPIRNSNVCIIGMGSFAIENAKRALAKGAKSVTFVSRSESFVSPMWLMHHSCVCLLQTKNLLLPKETESCWKEIINALRCTPKTKDYDLASSCIVDYSGKDHYLFTSTAQSDWFYAAIAFGAINVVRGLVKRVESSNTILVETTGHQSTGETTTLSADVVVLCTGHSCDTKLLSNIPLTSTMFGMNGKLTHNLRVDVLPNPTMYGPKCAVPHYPVLSFGIVSDIVDSVALLAIRDTNFYQKWIQKFNFYQNAEQCFIDNVDGRDWFKLSWKCLMNGFPALGCKVLGRFYDRYKVCCALESSGNGWYDTVTANWEGYIADLEDWRRQQFDEEEKKSEDLSAGSPESELLVPYPWPRPAPIVPPRRGRLYYQLLYILACLIGPEKIISILETLPITQAVLEQLLM